MFRNRFLSLSILLLFSQLSYGQISSRTTSEPTQPTASSLMSPGGVLSNQPASTRYQTPSQSSEFDIWESPATEQTTSSSLIPPHQKAPETLQPLPAVTNESPLPFSREPLPLKKPDRSELTNDNDESNSQFKVLNQTSITLLSLTGVVILILALAKVMRRHSPLGPISLPSETFQVLGRKGLDQKHGIHFVRCGSRILILGSSADGLRTLSEITDPVEVDRIAGECLRHQESQSMTNSFRMLLRNQSRQKPAGTTTKKQRPARKQQADITAPYDFLAAINTGSSTRNE